MSNSSALAQGVLSANIDPLTDFEKLIALIIALIGIACIVMPMVRIARSIKSTIDKIGKTR